jgi:hypothetical protein
VVSLYIKYDEVAGGLRRGPRHHRGDCRRCWEHGGRAGGSVQPVTADPLRGAGAIWRAGAAGVLRRTAGPAGLPVRVRPQPELRRLHPQPQRAAPLRRMRHPRAALRLTTLR